MKFFLENEKKSKSRSRMADIYILNEDLQVSSLHSEVSDLWEYANRYAGLDKEFFLRYMHINNSLFPVKDKLCRYPQAKVSEEDEVEREIHSVPVVNSGEEEQVDLLFSQQKEKYPPVHEQMERAEIIVEYARERFGLLQSHMAVVDLAYLIRYCEFGGGWRWNDE